MELLYILLVLLFVTRFAGEVAARLGQPTLIGELLSGLDRREALAVGAGMSARGAVELIIADIALRTGLYTRPEPTPNAVRYMFWAVLLMAILTTLLTPVALQRFQRVSP